MPGRGICCQVRPDVVFSRLRWLIEMERLRQRGACRPFAIGAKRGEHRDSVAAVGASRSLEGRAIATRLAGGTWIAFKALQEESFECKSTS